MGKTLRSDIIIGGKADGSFYQLGSELEQLGRQVNLVSEKLISFGKEGVETYVNYEDAMLDAKSAWATQYTNVADLNKVMQQAQKASLEWAADSVFTTQDVAEAISEAAHAGWTLEEVMSGVPAAMQIARAGGMGLSEGLEYMIDISHAAGIEFGDLGQLVDTWAYAANRSSTTIPEMGAAMQKMGATMQFVGGDMATLTTMLAVLANNGAKGTEAGTLLRNSFIRLVAPTKAAAEAMDALDITAADLEEIYSDNSGLSEASKLLEEYGFNAYDSEGNLKNFLQIYEELNAAMSGMTEQQQNEILSAIFPTRTITAARAFVTAAKDGWGGLYDDILKYSIGYADKAAGIMDSGLGYTLEHFESLMDTLKTKTGEAISPELTTWTNALSGMIENVNNMDSAAFNGLVTGLEVIAAAGPALMTAGAAVKVISMIAATGPVGKMILLGTGLTAAAAGIISYNNAIREAAYNENFGTLALNTQEISGYLAELNQGFTTAQQEISGYQEAVDAALQQYETASSTMKESILTKALTGTTLTEADQTQIMELGQTVSDALVAAINAGYQESKASLNLLAGEEEGTGIWAEMEGMIDSGFIQATARAEALSGQLRSAITSAFADEHLSAEESAHIQAIFNEMNALAAAQGRAQYRAERERILRKAQTLGVEGLAETYAALDAAGAGLEEGILFDRDVAVGSIMEAQELGAINPETGMPYTDADVKRFVDAQYAKAAQMITLSKAGTAADKIEANEMMLKESDMADVWAAMEQLYSDFVEDGAFTTKELNRFMESGTYDQITTLGNTLDNIVEELGGQEALENQINTLLAMGEREAAAPLQRILGMYGLQKAAANPYWVGYIDRDADMNARFAVSALNDTPGFRTTAPMFWDLLKAAYQNQDASAFQAKIDEGFYNADFLNGVNGIIEGLKQAYDFSEIEIPAGLEGISDYVAAWRIMYGGLDTSDIVKSKHGVLGTDAMQAATLPVTPVVDTASMNEQVESQHPTLSVSASVEIDPVKTGSMIRMFAEGGRSEEAAIFGEAGPEWAIPEEHTERTADLLRSAAEASGFTWPELLSSSQSSRSAGSWTVVYSPTINAGNADGVAAKLIEDKDRLLKWLKEKAFFEEVEVYA